MGIDHARHALPTYALFIYAPEAGRWVTSHFAEKTTGCYRSSGSSSVTSRPRFAGALLVGEPLDHQIQRARRIIQLSGQTPRTPGPPPSPGSRHVIDEREAALPTVPEPRLTAGSGPAAVVPTIFGVSLSQHCPGRRLDPIYLGAMALQRAEPMRGSSPSGSTGKSSTSPPLTGKGSSSSRLRSTGSSNSALSWTISCRTIGCVGSSPSASLYPTSSP